MKRILLLLLALLALTGCGAPAAERGYAQISMEEAAALMESEEDAVLLDVRTVEEFNDGHIPGAICIPNETIGSAEIPELPEKDRRILVYCRSGNRSKQAAQKLADLGYTNVMEFGGIRDWPGEVVSAEE